MQITLIGLVQLVLGLGLFIYGSLPSLFAFVAISTLFGGSAALVATALGSSTISPAHFALLFLILRCLMPGTVSLEDIRGTFRHNTWLLIFVVYGAIGAFLLPRIFSGALDVTPLRGQLRGSYGSELARILAAAPLRHSTQNITTAVYMVGTLLIALATYPVMKRENAGLHLAKIGGIIGIIHASFGFASVVLKGTPFSILVDFFRNANYAQVDQEWNGLVRMNGVFAEASVFAAFGIIWFAFNFECWLRGLQTRITGPATILLGTALILSTSSSAYIGLGIFVAILIVRLVSTPNLLTIDRLVWLTLLLLSGIIIFLSISVLLPAFAELSTQLLERMTVEKAGTFSGRQRLFWATQGLDAFKASYGLGIGPGSFRSSSLATAIIGSTGVIGTAAFLLYLIKATGPLHLSTYMRTTSSNKNCAAACVWAVVLGIAVASLSAASCDPGLIIAMLASAAIALRLPENRTEMDVLTLSPQQELKALTAG